MSLDKPYENIPGTTVFDSGLCRKGYHINQFCMSLMKEENRVRFKRDEEKYLADWPLTQEQKQAVLDRDYSKMISLGGNVYFLFKISSTDGISVQAAVSTMTDQSEAEYAQMMLSGGRSVEGLRYIEELG